MKAPTRTVWGLTWVGWLNILVLQHFFVRLAYAPVLLTGGSCYRWLTGIVPYTGWGSRSFWRLR
jgi:hypothetical protein